MNNNDDLKQKLNNENIEIPKTNNTSEEEKSNINVTPKKKSNMKSGTKAQLITLGVVLFFWIFLASSVISIIKSIVRGSKKSQIVYSQINYDTNQTASEPETTVIETVTTTEVAPTPVENTPITTAPEPSDSTAVPQNIPETNNNVAPQENTQQYSAYDDYDLQVLDKVYDEVINRGNESYLYNFSSSELAIIRNTLYARRGYRFKKKKYQQYFGSKPWYTPTTDSQNILPKKEERLANIIKKYE